MRYLGALQNRKQHRRKIHPSVQAAQHKEAKGCSQGGGGAHHVGHATTRFLEGLLEGSLKEVLLRRVLSRHLVRISVGTGVLRRVLRMGGGCYRRRLERP